MPKLPSLGGSPSGYYCGAERWAVKTLSEEDAGKIDLKPVPSTVAQLVEMPRPATIMENRRAAPVELTTYKIRAVLLEIRAENDHDMPVVVAIPGKTKGYSCLVENEPAHEPQSEINFFRARGPATKQPDRRGQ